MNKGAWVSFLAENNAHKKKHTDKTNVTNIYTNDKDNAGPVYTTGSRIAYYTMSTAMYPHIKIIKKDSTATSFYLYNKVYLYHLIA